MSWKGGLEAHQVVAGAVGVERGRVVVGFEEQHAVRRRVEPHHLELPAARLEGPTLSSERPGQRDEVAGPLGLDLEFGDHHVAAGRGR